VGKRFGIGVTGSDGNPIKVKPIITHAFSLSEWQRGFDLFENAEAIKVIFDMTRNN